MQIVFRLQSASMGRTFFGWLCRTHDQKRMIRAANKVIFRWKQGHLSAAFLAWQSKCTTRKHMLTACKIVRRWSKMELAVAYGHWAEYVRKQLALWELTEQVLMKWKLKVARQVWLTWHKVHANLSRFKRLLGKIMLCWNKRILSRAWRTWLIAQAEKSNMSMDPSGFGISMG